MLPICHMWTILELEHTQFAADFNFYPPLYATNAPISIDKTLVIVIKNHTTVMGICRLYGGRVRAHHRKAISIGNHIAGVMGILHLTEGGLGVRQGECGLGSMSVRKVEAHK